MRESIGRKGSRKGGSGRLAASPCAGRGAADHSDSGRPPLPRPLSEGRLRGNFRIHRARSAVSGNTEGISCEHSTHIRGCRGAQARREASPPRCTLGVMANSKRASSGGEVRHPTVLQVVQQRLLMRKDAARQMGRSPRPTRREPASASASRATLRQQIMDRVRERYADPPRPPWRVALGIDSRGCNRSALSSVWRARRQTSSCHRNRRCLASLGSQPLLLSPCRQRPRPWSRPAGAAWTPAAGRTNAGTNPHPALAL